MKQKIKIFIISPNDVESERFIARDVCDEFNEVTDEDIEISPIIWEDYPLTYTKNPQESIDDLLINADIYIVILWHRLGTTVEGCTGAITGAQDVTGTQYEIEKILALGKEHIYFYFKLEEPTFTSGELNEALKQKKLLEKFVDVMQLKQNRTKHGYQEFHTTKEFKKKIATHLHKEIERVSGKRLTVKKGRLYSVVSIFALLIGIVYYIFMLTSLKTTDEFDHIKNNITTKSTRRGIYIAKKNTAEQSMYYALLQTLKEKDKKVIKYRDRAAYEITLSAKSQEKKYNIFNETMIRSVCTIAYDMKDLSKDITIDVYQGGAEAMDFEAERAKKQCLKNAYRHLSNELIKVLKGL